MKQNRTYATNGARRARSGAASVMRATRGALSAQRVARLMAMMARDGETEELAEMIAEIVEPAEGLRTDAPAEQMPAAVPVDGITEAVEEIITGDEGEEDPAVVAAVVPAAPVTAAPVVQATPAAPAPAAPVAVAVPENHQITIDCGEEVLNLLRQIVSLLTPATDCGTQPAGAGTDECGTDPTRDEDPDGTVEAVVEAVTQAVEAAAADPLIPDEDPIEALVAEAVEGAVGGTNALNTSDLEGAADPSAVSAAAIGAAIGSALADPLTGAVTPDPLGLSDEDETESQVLTPENPDSDTPSARTADALRAAMATFRPILKSMAPAARRQAVAKIAANIRAQDRRRAAARSASGATDTYALLKGASRRRPVADPTGLGKKIMASRNANFRT